jgi:hypothetical protein
MFTIQQAERVPAWKQMVQEFEADDTKKNPYEVKITGKSVRIKNLRCRETNNYCRVDRGGGEAQVRTGGGGGGKERGPGAA